MTEIQDYMTHMVAVFENTARQGPGSPAATLRGFRALPAGARIDTILDIGCGKGHASLTLAEACDARITAVDNHPPFLAWLSEEARRRGQADRITPVNASMLELHFPDGHFDLLWSEGSAYVMGFENALAQWRRLIRKDGFLFVSDAVWFTDDPSPECAEFWNAEYPGITDPETRNQQAEANGYTVLNSFRLPKADWKAFYADVGRALKTALKRFGETPALLDLRREIDIHKRFGGEYGYLCLLLQKVATIP